MLRQFSESLSQWLKCQLYNYDQKTTQEPPNSNFLSQILVKYLQIVSLKLGVPSQVTYVFASLLD